MYSLVAQHRLLTTSTVVYEIKCVLDQILDLIENGTDGLLNDLGPELNLVIGIAAAIMIAPA